MQKVFVMVVLAYTVFLRNHAPQKFSCKSPKASHGPRPKQLLKLVALSALLLLSLQFAFAQDKVVAGKVIDSKDGSTISNVSVVAKGTRIGVQTDAKGNFRLTIPASVKTLTISAIGFSSQDIDVSVVSHIEVKLVPSPFSLNEVVVIGYGVAKKKDLTGAVASVSDKDFNKAIHFNKGIFTSADQLIQGKVSGVQIINNNGQPGSAVTIKIRGNSALTGTGQPLYVVDDVPLDGRSLQPGDNPLNFISPDDISSIDILKDASASAIYGSRASYGVVIINTKKGRAGKAKLDAVVAAGVSSVLKKIEVLDAGQYREAIKYYGVNNSYDKGGDADGMDGILQNGLEQSYSIAVSGGNENGKYRFSAGLLDQEGLLINTSFKKYNAGASANFKLLETKRLGLDINLNASQYTKDGSVLSSGDDKIIETALRWNPTEPLRKADGSLNITPGGNNNPIAQSGYLRDNLKVTTILGSISPSYKFLDWLEYKLLLSINNSTGISRFSVNQALFFPNYPIGLASVNDKELTTEQITNTINFDKQILHGLYLNAIAGHEYMKFVSKGFGLAGYGVGGLGFGNYGLDYTNYVQYSQADNRIISSYIDPKSELQSFFGRLIFNYEDRYLLTTTLRADGSTKFGANNKYGYFPSFAAAWNIGKEEFFKIGFVNALKIRCGWGKTGNQEFPPGSSQALYAFGVNGIIIQTNNPNPDLQWQSDRQYNIGIDFLLFNNKVSGTIDYFNKTTTNLLFPSPPIQPAPPASAVRWVNLDGEIINKGLEISISTSVVNEEKIGFDISANVTFLKNNVSGLPLPVFTGFVSGAAVEIIQNGLPMNAFYTRKFLGFDKSTGFSIYQDDGTTFYHVGDPNPKTLLGVSAAFRYKKLSLTANLNGSFGQYIFNNTLMSLLNVGGMNAGTNIALSVYQEPVKESFANPVTPSSRFIQKGDYLKMANLTISYNVGDAGKNLNGASVYVTAENLFILTKYPGFDPEVNVDRGNNSVPSLGIDYAHYPSSRSIILGIKISL